MNLEYIAMIRIVFFISFFIQAYLLAGDIYMLEKLVVPGAVYIDGREESDFGYSLRGLTTGKKIDLLSDFDRISISVMVKGLEAQGALKIPRDSVVCFIGQQLDRQKVRADFLICKNRDITISLKQIDGTRKRIKVKVSQIKNLVSRLNRDVD